MDPNYPTPLYTNPRDYFEGDPTKAETRLTRGIIYFTGAATLLSSSVAFNYLSRRPLYSGIQIHIGAIALGVLIGHGIYLERNKRFAQRDAIYRHYIELHPEDFPPIERKKYQDIFKPWIPIR